MKLPLGIQHFTTIREEGWAYVDKTRQIYELVTTGKFYFLSRPRRFGKSLTVSTLHELYTGNRKLFEGLWIEDRWDWQRVRPVVWLEFASSGYQSLGLEAAIRQILDAAAERHGLTLTAASADLRFQELITRLAAGIEKVVLLIDEYDKPLIDYVGEPEKMESNKKILKAFYSILKNAGDKIELLFITGVSAFSQVSLFSDLNNLTNLTLDYAAATLVGITSEELEASFAELLHDVDRNRLREWYNGYSWDGINRLYNPWSLLNYLRSKQFHNYWYVTGTPSFLPVLLARHKIVELPELVSSSYALLQFKIDELQPIPLLFQTGYLTMARPVDEFGDIVLDYPNREVRQALDQELLQAYTRSTDGLAAARRIRQAVLSLDFETMVEEFRVLLAAVPYEHFSGQNEHFFHAIFYLTLRTVGVNAKSEVHTARGRCDLLIELPEAVVVIEFKLNQSAEVALQQIVQNGYLAPYTTDPRRKVAVGVSINSRDKTIEDWQVTIAPRNP